MLRCVALHCVALRCVALCCVALCCVALCCIALRCVALRGMYEYMLHDVVNSGVNCVIRCIVLLCCSVPAFNHMLVLHAHIVLRAAAWCCVVLRGAA